LIPVRHSAPLAQILALCNRMAVLVIDYELRGRTKGIRYSQRQLDLISSGLLGGTELITLMNTSAGIPVAAMHMFLAGTRRASGFFNTSSLLGARFRYAILAEPGLPDVAVP